MGVHPAVKRRRSTAVLRREGAMDLLYGLYEQEPHLEHLRRSCSGLVRGDGPLDASVALVGEAPGKQEDTQGRPFVGPAGRVLEHLLDYVGLDRAQVYVTNVVKYRPPRNRTPTSHEVKVSVRYLTQELEIVQPEKVVLMGRTAAQALGYTAPMSMLHGVRAEEKWNGWEVFFSYHPAVAVYQSSRTSTLEDDFAVVFWPFTSSDR